MLSDDRISVSPIFRTSTDNNMDVCFDFHLFPKQHILDASKLKEFADENLKFYENDRKFFKWVENTVGKEEIAFYEQFLLFQQCFQKTFTADT